MFFPQTPGQRSNFSEKRSRTQNVWWTWPIFLCCEREILGQANNGKDAMLCDSALKISKMPTTSQRRLLV